MLAVDFQRRIQNNVTGNTGFFDCLLAHCLSEFPHFTECPLTLAAQLEGCAELIKVLKSGGAHLDFRTKDGITALHKAVRSKNHTALIVGVACTNARTHTHTHWKVDSSHLFLLLHQLSACKLPLPGKKSLQTNNSAWATTSYVGLNMSSLNRLAYSLNGSASVWFEEANNLNERVYMSHIIDFLMSQNCLNYFRAIIIIVHIFKVTGYVEHTSRCLQALKGHTVATFLQ